MSDADAPLDALGCRATARRIADGELDARARVEACLAAIEARDGEVGAFLHVDSDRALQRARTLDADPEARRLPLAGVPVAVKDNLCVAGTPTTAGSRMLEGWTAPYTATAVRRLEAAGAIIVGKTNLDEFGMGSSTEHSALGTTRHPHFPDRVAGGSSGGSAAAVAAGMVPAALGSDTGGSVRQPAAFCGIVGLKPTYGRVSRRGLVAFASSLDTIGPLARDAGDAVALLTAIAGRDEGDATSAAVDPPEPQLPDDVPLDELTIGVVDLDDESVQPGVHEAVEGTIEALVAAGARRRDLRLPHGDHALATYTVIATAEASSNLARYDGVRYGHRADVEEIGELYRRSRSMGLGPEVKRRILLGTFVLSAGHRDRFYQRALRARTLVARDFQDAFEEVDLIVGPTTPTTAFSRGSRLRDPLEMYRSDRFTVAASLAGLPAASIPCGTDTEGLPVGLQIVGPAFAESRILALAAGVEALRS